MTHSQRIQRKQSELRQKLGTLAAVEKPTDEQLAEITELRTELTQSETQLQAAIDAEAIETRQHESADSGERTEITELRNKASVGHYVAAAYAQQPIQGVEREFNAALGVAGNALPLELLSVEHRTKTDIDTQTTPSTWVSRVFATSQAARLGITMPSVPAGTSSYPVITAGISGAQRGREQAADDSAWAMSVSEVKPTRYSAAFEYTVEDAARLGEGMLESALVADMRASVNEAVDRAVFTGLAAGNEASTAITGLTTLAGLTEKTITQANKVQGEKVLGTMSEFIDGLYAETTGDIRFVASVAAYKLWLATLNNSAADSDTILAFLRDNGIAPSVRQGIEDAATTANKLAGVVALSRGLSGAAVAPVWSAADIVVDRITGHASGLVKVSLNLLHNFHVVRAANFGRVKFVA